MQGVWPSGLHFICRATYWWGWLLRLNIMTALSIAEQCHPKMHEINPLWMCGLVFAVAGRDCAVDFTAHHLAHIAGDTFAERAT